MEKTLLDQHPRLQRIIDAANEQPSPAIALTIATIQRGFNDKLYSLGRNPGTKDYFNRCKLGGKVGQFVSVMRRPETNVTHPNILSAPTDRVPQELLSAIINGPTVHPWREPRRRETYTFFEPRPVSSTEESGHHPIVYAVDNILAKKMGIAERIESGQFTYRAWLAALVNGRASYPLDQPYRQCWNFVEEPMHMANIVVEVDEASMRWIPTDSEAYSEIRKLTPQEFRDRHWFGAKGGEFFFRAGSRQQVESEEIDGICLPSTLAVLNQFEETMDKQGK